MEKSKPQPPILTPKETKKRLASIHDRLQLLYDTRRWKNQEEFQKKFLNESWDIDREIQKLEEAFTFATKVRWYEREKKKR